MDEGERNFKNRAEKKDLPGQPYESKKEKFM